MVGTLCSCPHEQSMCPQPRQESGIGEKSQRVELAALTVHVAHLYRQPGQKQLLIQPPHLKVPSRWLADRVSPARQTFQAGGGSAGRHYCIPPPPTFPHPQGQRLMG